MAHILFVDDEALTLRLLTQAAELAGHAALTARSLEEAKTVAVQHHPDLIFADLNLGDGSGLALTEYLAHDPRTADIPVIVLSADNTLDVQERVLQAGADRYLPKPIKIQTLIEVIREYTAAN